ncbi:LapA family protein [Mariprofundus sp. EBB-1]|uniref:lipopolysaccharide assembly protein LapA domain-containing protein n=1 Tax=Mariprofundus sp. EBB-1 TaxID=2650971 RepID=UPI000EF22AA5|nr:LapA family protein [Mariprofundus sp. EBB-1]RLL51963.1 LapA family protein [Mariprofundus sp. EBB-1]
MNLKLSITLCLIALGSIFIVQNADIVELHFLFWKIAMSRALMFIFLILIGVAIGWLLRGQRLHEMQKREHIAK